MLEQPMMDKLLAMRLTGMVEALRNQQQDPAARELSFLERLSMLVDQQWTWRQNQALARRLKTAKLRGNACVEDIDYRTPRNLDRSVIRALTQESAWVRNHEHVFVLGPTGSGKSFIASPPPIFSLVRLWFVLGGPQAADLGIGLHKFTTELLKLAELRHLAFGLVNRGGSGQRFRDGLGVHLVGEPQIRAVGRLAGLMATATRLATSAGSTGDGTSAQISEFCNPLRDRHTSLLQFGKGMGHGEGLHSLAYHIRKE